MLGRGAQYTWLENRQNSCDMVIKKGNYAKFSKNMIFGGSVLGSYRKASNDTTSPGRYLEN